MAKTKANKRNFHACHPIMKKGGPHQISKGGKRAAAKRETRKKASEWLSRPQILVELIRRVSWFRMRQN